MLPVESVLLKDLGCIKGPFKLIFLAHESADLSLWTGGELDPVVFMKVEVHLEASVFGECRLVGCQTTLEWGALDDGENCCLRQSHHS